MIEPAYYRSNETNQKENRTRAYQKLNITMKITYFWIIK